MPHFGSGSAGSPSPHELIRLWRSRLSTPPTPVAKADSCTSSSSSSTRRRRCRNSPPPPLAGVLSQQPKMSETQDVSSVVESSESSDTEITRQNSEIDEEREDSEQQDTRRSETPKSECPSTPSDEPAQNANGAVPDAERSPPPSPATPPQQQQKPPSSSPPPPSQPAAEPQAQKQQQQSPPAQPQQPRQPSRTGECNLLPVLVERLRSALELSCSSQSSEDQLPLEDSGVDSEEDFRLWSSGITGSPHQPSLNGGSQPPQPEQLQRHGELATGKPKLDLKFLEDILLADIHTALARLQDTLKRVDIGTLTRYNASLDPSNKLYLLRLISSLLAKLKVPDEALAQQDFELPNGRPAHFGPRRRKNERHTVSVTSDELAQARRWFDDKSVSSSESSPKVDIERERIVEGAPSLRLDSESAALQAERSELLVNAQPPAVSYERNGYNDKYMKDVINQQQSLQIKNNREYQNELPGKVYEHEAVGQTPRRAESHSKDDSAALRQQQDHKSASFHYHQQHPSTPLKHNKYTSKKSKIKRANTIDIPSYLKLKSDSPDHFHHGCFALRRPIDIGDRSFNVPQRVIPDFEPKTDNDRKFLALINRNTESGSSGASSPFKSFNYRQSSTVADKNWNSRFSNIKTTFDKPREDGAELQRKPGKLDIRKKFENISNDNLDREVSQAYKLPYGSPKPKHNGFTHAPTSPFQKIEKSSPKPDTAPAFLKSGYLPKNSSMLQAKVKLFDQESSKSSLQNNNADSSSSSSSSTTSRAKNKFGKPPENSYIVPQPVNKCAQQKKPSTQATENGHNYYSFCKQFGPFASGKSNSTEGKSAIDSAKSKFLENLSDESDHVELRRSKPKSNYQDPKMSVPRADPHDNRHNTPKQYQKQNDAHVFNQYQEPVKNYQNIQSYLQLEKKPQFNYPLKTYKDQEPSSYKPEIPPKKFAAPTQSVAVQTSLESTDRRLPEADLVNCTANLPQDHSIYQPKKLLNVSVQTTSPSIVTPAQRTSQSLCHTSTSPSIVSPIPHANQAIVEQTPVPTMPAATQYPAYPYPVNQVPQNYYNPSSLTDQDYHRADDFSYSSQPYSKEVHEIFKPPIKNVVPLKPTKEPCSGISQKLYNEFSKLPATNQTSRRFSDQDDYRRHDNSSLFSPVNAAYHEAKSNNDSEDKILRSEPIYEEKKLPPSEDLLEENIENQDISPDGVVTRYTCAIATVSSAPEEVSEATESLSSYPSQPYEPVVTRIKEPQQRHFAETTSVPVPAERKIDSGTSYDEIQRHNLLQQALMRRMQSEQQFTENMAPRRLSQEIAPKESQSGQSPTFNGTSSSSPGQINALKALTESHKAQDRINFFEEKRLNNKQLFRPLNVGAKVNVVPPTTVAQQSERAASMRNNASPIDSSDEYLMSCASKPSRHLVLSKSESWHQLAMARGLGGGLQVPGQPGGPGQLKPPKPKSPASLRLSKQFEASLGTDNARKMEEKIQRYFQRPGPAGAAHLEEPASRAQQKQQQQTSKRESKSKRVLQSKRTTSNSLARSATMPHLYDDRLFDDSVDVDKAFDSIFKEATRTDNRH